MRVANKTVYDRIIRDLGSASHDMVKANEIVTTNKKINKLSDDPVGLVSVLGLRSSLSNINQIERNLNMGRSWLVAGESALTQIENILAQAKELSVQYSNASNNSTQRANAASIVDGLLREVLSLANSKSGQRYIFGGTDTDTSPFAFNATETQVNYSGNDTPFSIQVGKDTNVAVGRDGKEIFGENWDSNNIFKTLIDFKTNLQSNDVSEIMSAMEKLDLNLDNVRAVISDTGGKTIRLNVKENIIQDMEITYTERKSNIEEADFAEAVMKLKSMELAYNASLASSAKVMALSLVDFL